jgi:DNA polymerase IV
MEACVESVFPHWMASWLPRSWATTGPSLSRPSATVHEQLPKFVHVSLDSFFAAVEQQRNPKLQGKAVLVGRSTVLSASQEAMLAGVQPRMSIEAALQCCPGAIVLAGNFALYAEYAEQVRALLAQHGARVEDGAKHDFFLEFSGRYQPLSEFQSSLLRLQMKILQETGLSISIGAGNTRAIAAIASRLEGPRGLTLVAPGAERTFLDRLPVTALSGVSSARAAKLAACEVTTIGDLARVPRIVLERGFGKFTGGELWHRARGRDAAACVRPAERQSLSQQTTIDGGMQDSEEVKRTILYLCERIAIELHRRDQEAASMSLAIRYIDDYSAQQSLRIEPFGDGFQRLALRLLHDLFTRPVAVERITVSVDPRNISERTLVLPQSDLELAAAVNQ